ncbi:hypothetical protein ACFOD4_19490 [Pseudoroseomonas globiformis]|uniref:Uncharacterized protein n=1 Tax=Teichococcus globiformis TaxID=2307229 RepID=A0ABV7G723_9PROT
MRKTQSFLAVLTLALSAGMAQAQTLSMTGHGENFGLDYGSGHIGNIVGGGAIELHGGGQEGRIVYRDAAFARRPSGVPVDAGGEGQLVYLPLPSASMMMSVR